jgi:hypothetical protein
MGRKLTIQLVSHHIVSRLNVQWMDVLTGPTTGETFTTISCGNILWILLVFCRRALFLDVKLVTCLSPITRFGMATATQRNV